MDTKYNFFVFVSGVPMNITKGVVYITPYGEDYINIFRSITQYKKTIGDIEESDENKNIFIDRGVYSSSLDFRIKNPTLPRESIFIQTDESVAKILNKLKNNEEIEKYDIFSAKDTTDLEENELTDLKQNMKIFYYIMLQYMSAGYHKGQNKRKIPDWCLCFSEPIMKYFLHYFEILTESPDINVVDQFLTTPQYREMITLQMMKFMANYLVNNKIIDPNAVDTWYNVELWLSIKNNI